MDLTKLKKAYLIGIKGVGMTMLAQYLAGQGTEVSGSDSPEKFMTDQVLKRAGVKVREKFAPGNIPADADLIIYSTAYNPDNNPELALAWKSKTELLSFPQALARIFNQHYGIAVVGSHGKTTTTAWLGYVLDRAGFSPSVMVGSLVPQFQGFSLRGQSNYLLAEIDEYQNKLQYFQPKMVLLNNIDYDHPDFFPSAADYQMVFIEFIKKIPGQGVLIANLDDPVIRKTARVNCRGKVVTYALEEAADFVAYDIRQSNGQQFFKVKLGVDDDPSEGETSPSPFRGVDGAEGRKGGELGDFSIQLIGRHNVYNALAVIAACVELGVVLVDIRKHLEEFTGTARRLQLLGQFRGALIIDDYAHHPTEIKASLAAARQRYQDHKIIVVFHPHTFSRTRALFDDFAGSFSLADEVIILDIYGSARERRGGVHSRQLVEAITKQQAAGSRQQVSYIPTLDECEKYLRDRVERGDVVLLMGAGDVFRIGERLVK